MYQGSLPRKGRYHSTVQYQRQICFEKTILYYIFDQRCLLGAILGHLGAILGPKMIKFCPFSIVKLGANSEL